jgi:hypothetical protein
VTRNDDDNNNGKRDRGTYLAIIFLGRDAGINAKQ